MSWIKLEPVKGGPAGCSVCGYNHETYPLDSIIAAGFGACQVSKDDELIYCEHAGQEEYPKLQKFEDIAAVDPDHDYRLLLVLPLREVEYQRHQMGKWVLIRSDRGFA